MGGALSIFIMYPHFFDSAKKRRYDRQRNAFYPLQFAPANAVPLSKGTKTLHRKNNVSDSRPLPLGVGHGFHFTSVSRL